MGAPTYLVLHRESALIAMEGLGMSREPGAPAAFVTILDSFRTSPNGGASVRVPVSDGIVSLLRSVHAHTGLVQCARPARWISIYRHPEDETVPHVTVRSYDRPLKRRTLKGPGGRRRYIRVTMERIPKEEQMATKTRARKAKPKPADDLEDLEALEELEDLEDVEDEEPAPKPKRRSRPKAQPEPEDDDDDEEDEEEEPAPRKRRSRPATKERKDTPPNKSSKAKPKASAKKTPPAPRAMPAGKMSVTDLAEELDTSGASLRQWLRRNDYEVDEDLGRYAFSKKEAAAIKKAFKA